MVNSDTIINTLVVLLFVVIWHLMLSSVPVLEALGKILNALVFMVSAITLIIWKLN
ncbi:hypothetical protein [Lactococcus garvieae]|uniref:hypothetical protein n=1 Tax=Lactococcus garvieae TaxID=1363 RepID=UPI00254D42AE|nr:hypothetical protein [Lactococcus garvieae]